MHTTHDAWHTGDTFFVAGSSLMLLLTEHVVCKTGHLNRCMVEGGLFYNKPDPLGLSPSLATSCMMGPSCSLCLASIFSVK